MDIEMSSEEFAQLITDNLDYAPNRQQELVIGALARFCAPASAQESVFLLNGYAGTGKTSICGALVKALRAVGLNATLLAPTGRAAKVFSNYAGFPAYTIHRKIYRYPGIGDMSSAAKGVLENKSHDTIFIVDEASMISASGGGDDLLQDLIQYVYTGENCRLLLLGDTAQLPPVGSAESPAMVPDVLRGYGLKVTHATLTETARQAAHSGILYNATWLRRAMRQDPIPLPKLTTAPFNDIKLISGEDMPEELYTAYNRDGLQESIVITRSNMRAGGFNREIRANVLYLEQELARGELLLVGKNNYFWAEKVKEIEFIANGDVLEVQQVHATEEKYGIRFADVRVSVPDTDIQFDAKIFLDSLHNDSAGMTAESLNQLYYGIMEDPSLFDKFTPADARLQALKKNPCWNALQVKYAYALTCHKSQGGQWKNVFVDMAYIPAEAMGMEFYRWLYTAVTRARKRLFILGAEQYESN